MSPEGEPKLDFAEFDGGGRVDVNRLAPLQNTPLAERSVRGAEVEVAGGGFVEADDRVPAGHGAVRELQVVAVVASDTNRRLRERMLGRRVARRRTGGDAHS